MIREKFFDKPVERKELPHKRQLGHDRVRTRLCFWTFLCEIFSARAIRARDRYYPRPMQPGTVAVNSQTPSSSFRRVVIADRERGQCG